MYKRGIIILLIIFIAIWLFGGFKCNSGCREGYGTPLGQLAPYNAQFNACINECNRENPNTRLSENNYSCGVYCASTLTDMAQKGVPSSTLPISDTMTQCQNRCRLIPTKLERDQCESDCFGQVEVAKWCKELYCPYSIMKGESTSDECMKQCIAVNSNNSNQTSWTWMIHG